MKNGSSPGLKNFNALNKADLLSQSKAFQFHHRFLRSWNRFGKMNFYFGFIFTHYSYKRETTDDKRFVSMINSTHYTQVGSKKSSDTVGKLTEKLETLSCIRNERDR